MRVTKQCVIERFKYLCKLMNKTIGYEVGNWKLCYASCYGGWRIDECMEHGGEDNVFGSTRRSTAEMASALSFAIEVLREHNTRKEVTA